VAVLNRTLDRSEPRPAPSLRLAPVLLVAGLALVVIALLQIVQTSEATTTSFSIQTLKQDKLELESTVRGLEAEVGRLSSIERVEREAARLGLQPATSRMTVNVNVPLPATTGGALPSRFAPDEANEIEADGSPWWRELLEALPFN